MKASHPGRAGNASQPHERNPLHIRTEAETGGDAGIERRDGDAGHCRRHDHVDIADIEPGVAEGAGNRIGTELDGHVDERVVGSGEIR